MLYQIYPRSFADSNHDGYGDLPGITQHLDYLAWLGIDGIWLNPTMPSPNGDWGYDVSDYTGVHPDFGTLDDMDRLVEAAGKRGIHVLLDLVPNHTSSSHPWFTDALSSRTARHRDWYVFAAGRDGGPPNNWLSATVDPAWTLDEKSGEWYLHNFLPCQPDLNWWNPEVKTAFDEILRFWLDRHIAGFRIDVAHGIVKDAKLRNNPPAQPLDPKDWVERGQRPLYNGEQPEVHEIHRHWRRLADEYQSSPLLYGETYVTDPSRMVPFYGTEDAPELHLTLNAAFLDAPFDPSVLRSITRETFALLPPGATATWTVSNHDKSRFTTRWGGGEEDRIRCILMLLLLLPGVPVIYYGDELGMEDTRITLSQKRDTMVPHQGNTIGRDPSRTPMPWNSEPGAGFTAPTVTPWLPFGTLERNVADQKKDADSTLNFTRKLIALRRSHTDLRESGYAELPEKSTWGWRRGAFTVVLNLGDLDADCPSHGRPMLTTSTAVERNKTKDGSRIMQLPAWSGALFGPPE